MHPYVRAFRAAKRKRLEVRLKIRGRASRSRRLPHHRTCVCISHIMQSIQQAEQTDDAHRALFPSFLLRDATEPWYTAMVLCLSVCLSVSVKSRSSTETAERIELILAWELPSTYPTQCYKEIRVSPKIRVLPSGTTSQTLDLIFPRHVDRSHCQQNSSTVELVDHTYDGWRVVTGRT